MNGEPEDEEPLVFRYGGDSGEPAYVPLRLTVVGNEQIVLAEIHPELPVSRIAAQWASALDLSHGASVVAHLVSGAGDDAEEWGPGEMLTPEVDAELDYEITDEGSGGFLLGRDFLRLLWVVFLGPVGVVVFMRSPDE